MCRESDADLPEHPAGFAFGFLRPFAPQTSPFLVLVTTAPVIRACGPITLMGRMATRSFVSHPPHEDNCAQRLCQRLPDRWISVSSTRSDQSWSRAIWLQCGEGPRCHVIRPPCSFPNITGQGSQEQAKNCRRPSNGEIMTGPSMGIASVVTGRLSLWPGAPPATYPPHVDPLAVRALCRAPSARHSHHELQYRATLILPRSSCVVPVNCPLLAGISNDPTMTQLARCPAMLHALTCTRCVGSTV